MEYLINGNVKTVYEMWETLLCIMANPPYNYSSIYVNAPGKMSKNLKFPGWDGSLGPAKCPTVTLGWREVWTVDADRTGRLHFRLARQAGMLPGTISLSWGADTKQAPTNLSQPWRCSSDTMCPPHLEGPWPCVLLSLPSLLLNP